jgi:hypothetical protein
VKIIIIIWKPNLNPRITIKMEPEGVCCRVISINR